MSAKLTWTQAVTFMGGDSNRLAQYLKGDTSSVHPNFDANLSIADGQMRSRIISRYTTVSYDALDSSSCPAYVQYYLFCLTLAAATSHDDNRPDAIDKYAAIAGQWLNDIQDGRAKIAELTEIPSGSTTAYGASSGGRTARINAPDDILFDSDSASGEYITKVRPI